MGQNDTEESLREIIFQLRNITERLDELSFDSLRVAVREGMTKRPEMDKRLVKVRNQILKTIRLLESNAITEESDEED